jgi:hypothetical protein
MGCCYFIMNKDCGRGGGVHALHFPRVRVSALGTIYIV